MTINSTSKKSVVWHLMLGKLQPSFRVIKWFNIHCLGCSVHWCQKQLQSSINDKCKSRRENISPLRSVIPVLMDTGLSFCDKWKVGGWDEWKTLIWNSDQEKVHTAVAPLTTFGWRSIQIESSFDYDYLKLTLTCKCKDISIIFNTRIVNTVNQCTTCAQEVCSCPNHWTCFYLSWCTQDDTILGLLDCIWVAVWLYDGCELSSAISMFS